MQEASRKRMARLKRTLGLMVATVALAGLAACSGGSTGKVSVMLVDGPSDYQQINVDVQRVELHSSADGWVVLATPNRVINILDLRNGVVATLVDGATVAAGQYQQLRLVLGPNNSVVLQDGTTADLTVPSGLQSGIKMNLSFSVQPGTTKDLFIDFDAAHSIHIHQTGASEKYILRPTIRVFDKIVTGSIEGRLTATVGGEGLGGVLVTAQQVNLDGRGEIVRSVLTEADGTYHLDLIPIGVPVHVVSQPVSGDASYEAQASPAITLTEADPIAQYDASFVMAAGVGEIAGSITPVAEIGQGDVVLALQSFSALDGSPALVVRSGPSTVGGAETYGFSALPVGVYDVVAIRTTIDAQGNATVVESTPQSNLTVAAAVTVTADLSF